MKYSAQEVLQYIAEEDVKFIRLAFCDVFGKQKNISVMPQEMQRAFSDGIAIDASAIDGFADEAHSDLLLHPDPATLAVLPWRPEHGRVVRMFCSITHPDGTPFSADTRTLLANTVAKAKQKGLTFSFGSELEFYLFRLDAEGNHTKMPYDRAGYLDIAPDDRGENVRREICLTLEQMGILPESSHHEEGPGQNEIVFRYADPMNAADNAVTFQSVVRTVAYRNGLWADFSPKPLTGEPGNGFHINFSVHGDGEDPLPHAIEGILSHIREMTLFLNPDPQSCQRFGNHKAPGYISWSRENRSQLIRIPAAAGAYRRAELRSPDPTANPYLAFALLTEAALDGIASHMPLREAVDLNLYTAPQQTLSTLTKLPSTAAEAVNAAARSSFIRTCLPEIIINAYCK